MKRTIRLKHITKIEGHAELTIEVEKGQVRNVQLAAFEGARYFEGILRKRKFNEAPILSSRICGICSCIHTTAALLAIEDALDVTPSEQTMLLREVMCLGERIRSHATHLYLFTLPDYLGFSSAIAMSAKHKSKVTRALELIKLGNDIVMTVGGREMHPVAPIIGGFSRLPEKNELDALLSRLGDSKKDAMITGKLFAGLTYPEFERDTTHFALDNDENYAILDGKISCVGEACIPLESYMDYFKEFVLPYSTAKYVLKEGKEDYMVSSLSRVNEKMSFLSDDAMEVLRMAKIKIPCNNPFLNNVAQAAELVHSIDRIIEILSTLKLRYERPRVPRVKAGRGISCVEAPRGLLFHDYELDKKGIIQKANIITPTAQNVKKIENDLWSFVQGILNKPKKEIILAIEKLIRAYDPCISCSTHFLKVNWRQK